MVLLGAWCWRGPVGSGDAGVVVGNGSEARYVNIFFLIYLFIYLIPFLWDWEDEVLIRPTKRMNGIDGLRVAAKMDFVGFDG